MQSRLFQEYYKGSVALAGYLVNVYFIMLKKPAFYIAYDFNNSFLIIACFFGPHFLWSVR